MAKPMTADQLVREFKRWEVPVHEHPKWRTHRRDPEHGSWGPVNGIGLHHTGDDAPDDADERLLFNGRPGLPGPLCTWGMRDTGVAVMIGSGRANHFGSGSAATLQHVINEDYSGDLHPGPDGVDGNSRFYGQETMYSGGHPMTIKAYRSTVRAFAAICSFHGWTAKSCIGHKEWTRRKIDPGNLKMGSKFRVDVQAAINAGPGNWPVKEPVGRESITKMRERIRAYLKVERKPTIRAALMAADVRLARLERR